ncbi:MAG: precorrin-3B C(17)-methyltransferase [Pseudomonadota bacterium]
MAQPVLIALTQAGEDLALRIAPSIGAVVHGRAGRTTAEITFAESTAHIRDLFAAGVPVIGLCAAGILIRAVSPLLSDKTAEPPVIAVAEDGSAVVPLLGGHHGANGLATEIAAALRTRPALTTASDVALGVALDDPPPGWRLVDDGAIGPVTAGLVAGANAHIAGTCQHLEPLTRLPNVTSEPFVDRAQARDGARLSLIDPDGLAVADRAVVYEPMDICVGVGCARGCPGEELEGLARAALASAGLAPEAVAGVFSLDLKADEAAVLDLAASLGVSARFFDAAALELEAPRLANPSDVVFAEVGCHGVAEGAALAAAGPDGRLVVEKQKSANATVAIALAPAPITDLPGRARGQVSLIGIGPGQAAWRTPEASRLVQQADELVGYGLYIDLLGPLARGKPRHDFPLGGEEDRCRYALEQAGQGRHVALICSGDAGIYAMGALVYELMARGENGVSDAARRVEVVTAPGISALQAAAARIGAPLGHDFCAISLSDLLTPRADIQRRIRAAADGDFVIAFYNPVSKRRRDLFAEAIGTLRGQRSADTPVVLARSLGRQEEAIEVHDLSAVEVDMVDMLTVVLVGSSQSQRVSVGGRPRVFTPRGYAVKHERAAS